MKIKIEHIRERTRQYSFTESAETFPVLADMASAGECSFTGPVNVNITAGREFDHYRVDGMVTVPIQQDCSRCLCSFDKTVCSSFTIFFRENFSNHDDEDEVELAERDLITAGFSGDEIDLSMEIAEQVALEIPVKPLCSDACKGLCPVCGVDLNTETCNCVPDSKQSRFAALKNFKISS